MGTDKLDDTTVQPTNPSNVYWKFHSIIISAGYGNRGYQMGQSDYEKLDCLNDSHGLCSAQYTFRGHLPFSWLDKLQYVRTMAGTYGSTKETPYIN